MPNERVSSVVASPAWDSLMQRIRAAADKWVQTNAQYLRARMTFDAIRIANLRSETSAYLDFANAKARVKEATDAYYRELSLITLMKNQVNSAKTADKLSETLKSLIEQRKGLISQALSQASSLGK